MPGVKRYESTYMEFYRLLYRSFHGRFRFSKRESNPWRGGVTVVICELDGRHYEGKAYDADIVEGVAAGLALWGPSDPAAEPEREQEVLSRRDWVKQICEESGVKPEQVLDLPSDCTVEHEGEEYENQESEEEDWPRCALEGSMPSEAFPARKLESPPLLYHSLIERDMYS
ncbi:hypothetical protein L227DRAFT_208686 [Lentinus tigrinus ALCF2SS1-6]|uniref:Uncharacterized protein n=1 Tax=Lentinus tigrinus ALCF2SS1-6 TaxID=1328759 RepID=A0A5C2SVS9_9APHY|nr:hypothetical protein L227DRAFT_208686 [Lentinus tigrinus ALCF2SS1-6]